MAPPETAAAAPAERPARPSARRRGWLGFAGLAPLVLWQCVFFVGPLLLLVVYSCMTMQGYRVVPEFTLENYHRVLTSPPFWKSAGLSVMLATLITVCCALLGFPVAYFIARKAGRWRNLLLVCVVAPFWISLVMRIAAWRLLLGEHGFVNGALSGTGLIAEPLGWLLYSPFATGIGCVYAYLPLVVLPIYSSIEKIEENWIAAARNLSATPFQVFIEIILPLSLPGLLIGCGFSFIFGLGEFVAPALLGGGKTMMMSQVIQNEFQNRLDWPTGSAMSIVMLAMIGLVLAGIAFGLRHRPQGKAA